MSKDPNDHRKEVPSSYYGGDPGAKAKLNKKLVDQKIRQTMSWKDRFLDITHDIKEYFTREAGEVHKKLSVQFEAAKAKIYKVDRKPEYEAVYARNEMSFKDWILDAVHNISGKKGESPQLQAAKEKISDNLRAPTQQSNASKTASVSRSSSTVSCGTSRGSLSSRSSSSTLGGVVPYNPVIGGEGRESRG